MGIDREGRRQTRGDVTATSLSKPMIGGDVTAAYVRNLSKYTCTKYVWTRYVALQDAWYVRRLHVRRFKWTLKFAIVDVFVIGYCFYLFPNKC